MARRISPPSAWPSPNLSRSTSVVSEADARCPDQARRECEDEGQRRQGKEPNTLSIESPHPPQLTQRTRRRLRPRSATL